MTIPATKWLDIDIDTHICASVVIFDGDDYLPPKIKPFNLMKGAKYWEVCDLFISNVFYCCLYVYREFVNSVWCIKILSPGEVQQMGKRGLELLSSVPVQRLSNNNSTTTCDNYASRQESRNLSSGIASVGSLDYWKQIHQPVKIFYSSVVLLAFL